MDFKKLEREHFPQLNPFFAKQPYRLSLFSVASVFTWRKEAGLSVYFSIHNDVLFMAGMNPTNGTENYLSLPLPAESHGPLELADLAGRLGFSSFNLIPDDYVKNHGVERIESYFDMGEQAIYCDYVYDSRTMAELPGPSLSKKRNLIKQFERDFVEPGRVQLESISQTNESDYRTFITEWYRERENGFDAEAAAIRTIEEFATLELTGIAVRIDGRVAGMGTCAPLTEDMGVLNLEMADPNFRGLYQFLDRECAARLFVGRFKFINKESDMGLPGLAQSKRSYQPDFRVRCYKLTLKANPNRNALK